MKAAPPVLVKKTPGVCGGSACIQGTRIPVWYLGLTDSQILRRYPSISAIQLSAAWEYAAANEAEIQQDIWENQAC